MRIQAGTEVLVREGAARAAVDGPRREQVPLRGLRDAAHDGVRVAIGAVGVGRQGVTRVGNGLAAGEEVAELHAAGEGVGVEGAGQEVAGEFVTAVDPVGLVEGIGVVRAVVAGADPTGEDIGGASVGRA